MWLLKLALCFATGFFLPVQSTFEDQIGTFSHGIFDNGVHLSPKGDFGIPFDTMFSSWQTKRPDFHMLAALPPFMKVPKIQVLCDESGFMLLVDKVYSGVQLNSDELRLGDGCHSNGDLENKFVFTYDFTQCGTNRVVQNDLEVFSNLIHVNPRKSIFTWWSPPFTLPVSCTPKRLKHGPPNFLVPLEFPREDKLSFAIRPMNSIWDHTTMSMIYERGQMIHFQVIATPGPGQQPFIQSCFVSASANPHFRPRQAVILNKGCTSVSAGADHVMAEYVASTQKDAINLVLNTSTLNSEVYIHCSLLMSDWGITPGSKSCNYDKIQSRWEELSGDVEVCSCCGSKCKGPSIKQFNLATKALVSTGPFYIVDKEIGGTPLQPDSSHISRAEMMQSDASGPVVTEYQTSSTYKSGSGGFRSVESGATFSDSNEIPEASWDSPPGIAEGMVILSRGPVAGLAMWLPGRGRAANADPKKINSPLESDVAIDLVRRDSQQNDIPNDPVATGEDPPLSPSAEAEDLHEVESDSMTLPPLVDGWPIPSTPEEEAAVLEESKRKRWVVKPEMLHPRAQEVSTQWPGEDDLKPSKDTLTPQKEELPRSQRDAAVEHYMGASGLHPIIRSKVQFSKDVNGLQSLSYEEEVVRPKEEKPMMSVVKEDVDYRTGHRGLLYTFLELLRGLAE